MAFPVANTTLGLVKGTWLPDGTAQWLGLPYAKADRWSAPIDAAQRYAPSAFDATAFGPSCPQGVSLKQN